MGNIKSIMKVFTFTRNDHSPSDPEAEIDALYKRVEESAQVDVSPPDAWDEEGTRGFVRDVVSEVMRAPNIADDEDLFQQGCDRCALSAEVVASHSVRLM